MSLHWQATIGQSGSCYRVGSIFSEHYCSAFLAASCYGHDTIVRLLIGNGADVNTGGGDYGSALQAARSHDCPSTLRLLLDSGAC
jgi:ankyrin repeat protein